MPLVRILSRTGEEIRAFDPAELSPDGHAISVGRSTQCTVALKGLAGVDQTVGSHHFSLTKKEGGWWVVDAGSTGLCAGGNEVAQARLTPDDRIKFGSCFLVVGGQAGISPYDLFYETNVGQIRREKLWSGKNWVGSSKKNTIRIEDAPSCSRRHACITVDGDNLTVADLGSRNGTKVGGKPVTGSARVKPGEVFRAGKVKLWIDLDECAENHLRRNTLLKDKYFRLLLLLLGIFLLIIARAMFLRGR
jgi:pSer/pThr/pTyr-binding forkhead associated (FHA) protein